MSGNTSATGGIIAQIPPPPPSGAEITAALQQVIIGITGLPGTLVRPRWQPTPPTQPSATTTWASIGITHFEAADYPSIEHDGTVQLPGAAGPGVDILTRFLTLTALATFYGPEAENCAGALRDGLYIPQNWEAMAVMGLALREVRDLARAPELINQQWIDRLDVSLQIAGAVVRTYPVLNLDGADVILRRDYGDADVTDDLTVTVRPNTILFP